MLNQPMAIERSLAGNHRWSLTAGGNAGRLGQAQHAAEQRHAWLRLVAMAAQAQATDQASAKTAKPFGADGIDDIAGDGLHQRVAHLPRHHDV